MQKVWNAVVAFVLGLFSEAHTVTVKVKEYFNKDAKAITAAEARSAEKLGAFVSHTEKEIQKVARIWDDKRTFGFLWIMLALAMPFVFPAAHLSTLVSSVAIGFALYLGVPLGDSVPFLGALESQGILDLITNKANQGDGLRFFGILFQFVAWGYLFAPLLNPAVQFRDDVFMFFGGAGVVMAWTAVWGDHAAVQAGTK